MNGAFVGAGTATLSPLTVQCSRPAASLTKGGAVVRRRQIAKRPGMLAVAAATASDVPSPCSVDVSTAVEDSDSAHSVVRISCGSVPRLLKAMVASLVDMDLTVEGYSLRTGGSGQVDVEIQVLSKGGAVPDSQVDTISSTLSDVHSALAELDVPVVAVKRAFVERPLEDLENPDEDQFADYESGAFVRVDNNALTTLSSVTYFSADRDNLSLDILSALYEFDVDVKFASTAVSDFDGRYRTAVFHISALSGDKVDDETEYRMNTRLFELTKGA